MLFYFSNITPLWFLKSLLFYNFPHNNDYNYWPSKKMNYLCCKNLLVLIFYC
jgi:hypothetical protein